MNAANNDTGYCTTVKETRVKGDFRDYLDLSVIIEQAGISESNATKFLNAVRRICYRHELVLPLPTEYRNLKRTVIERSSERLMPIKKVKIRYPKELFPNEWETLKPMTFVHVDIMLTIAEMLTNRDFVGKKSYVTYLHLM